MKRLQNRIAESGVVLPVMAVYGLVIWLVAGLVTHNWWPQLACFALSAYSMVEMNNSFALLRVRSRMVSATFIALTCAMSFLFGSLSGALVQLFFIIALLLLLSTYQEPMSLGRIFYAFVFLGLASVFSVQTMVLIPLLWLLMATQLQSLSGRGLMASLIGLATPWWFICLWFIIQHDFTPLTEHFAALADFTPLSHAYAQVTQEQLLAWVLTAVLTLTGIIHFWRNSIDEKIRTRLLYGLFTWMSTACLLLTALQPQHFDPLMRMAVVCASPPIAHFLTLSSTRITNVAFFVIAAVTLAVTVVNLLISA
jgi:hypothetical protein